LFTDRIGARKILGFYKTLVPGLPTYKELVLQNKKLILKEHMAGEWENLLRLFSELGLLPSFARKKIKDAIGLLMLSLPVYRIYPDTLPLQGEDLKVFQTAFATAKGLESDCRQELDYLESLFTTSSNPADETKILRFLRRLMQFTGPLTAKGVEDTTFYVYSPLISHDEVGDSPSRLGISIQEFHRKMIERQKHVPLALNATSTHDTKRGEDARMRLNVLSVIPDEWIDHVQHWLEINQKFTTVVGTKTAPEVNEIYFIYQSIVGGFPSDTVVTDEFVERIQTYLTKVMREAKVNSSWEAPDEAYEKAALDFVAGILHDEEFLGSFVPFVKNVMQQAGVCSLGQTLLKITAPGIPDTYQGTELWDLSFVDPDNRRPVDYAERISLLEKINSFRQDLDALNFLNEHQHDGVAKLFVTWKALNFRKTHDHLFIKGDYVPIELTGENNALAFARRSETQWVLVIVPLDSSATSNSAHELILPEGAPSNWKNILTNKKLSSTDRLSLVEVFADFPVALLYSI
jgi:(1->4)-alpha-D-glucan 1-alpha-D-glucosylmutase